MQHACMHACRSFYRWVMQCAYMPVEASAMLCDACMRKNADEGHLLQMLDRLLDGVDQSVECGHPASLLGIDSAINLPSALLQLSISALQLPLQLVDACILLLYELLHACKHSHVVIQHHTCRQRVVPSHESFKLQA